MRARNPWLLSVLVGAALAGCGGGRTLDGWGNLPDGGRSGGASGGGGTGGTGGKGTSGNGGGAAGGVAGGGGRGTAGGGMISCGPRDWYCVSGTPGGQCGDALSEPFCTGREWACPSGQIRTSECACLGRPAPGCQCTPGGMVCAPDGGVSARGLGEPCGTGVACASGACLRVPFGQDAVQICTIDCSGFGPCPERALCYIPGAVAGWCLPECASFAPTGGLCCDRGEDPSLCIPLQVFGP
jgi:hypothetical protein